MSMPWLASSPAALDGAAPDAMAPLPPQPAVPDLRLEHALPAPEPAPSLAYDAEACRRLMRGGSKTFFAASLLLPDRVCASASALYAFCRLADDAIDCSREPQAAVQALRERLDAVYAGRPQALDADRALAMVVHAHAIPRELLDALIEGFVWDADGRRYETLDELLDYAARVAATVGAMMALVMDTRDRDALARACDLGLAMQLTNIARDVGEDARNGRVYLPLSWLREAGIDPQAWLAEPLFTPALAGVIQRLLDAADVFYRRAEAGVAALPRDCRAAIQAARLVYAEIGRQLERDGLDAVNHRAHVSPQRKLRLVARALVAAVHAPGESASRPAHASVQALVDAAATAPRPAHPMPRNFQERVGWVLELFERQMAQRRRPAGTRTLAQPRGLR